MILRKLLSKFSWAAVILLTLIASWTSNGFAEVPHLETATFAGGCFWCMEPFLAHLKGVKSVTVGYTGGQKANPTYEEVSSGTTGHAESIQVVFDPTIISYARLLKIYWHNIDPTMVNGQFADQGTQYRTAIFYRNDEQKRLAEESKKELAASGKFDRAIVTEIVPASTFYPAEDYHQHYYKTHALQYNLYHAASGRDQFLKRIWGNEKPE